MIERVIEAGRAVPSGSNSQTTHMIVITYRKALDELAAIVQEAFAAMEVGPDQYHRVVWQCNSKFSGVGEAGPKLKCTTPTLTEEQIKEAFEQVLAKLALGRGEIIANLREVQSQIADVSQLEAERVILVGKHKDVDILFQQEITRNASVAQDQDA